MRLTVPCNKCCECIKAQRDEWYFRSYHQVQDTLAKGGYVYFDTLTYSEEYVPRLSHYVDTKRYKISNMYCFDHEDIQLFFKRLRRQLQYHCGSSDFKYFITSEYGSKNTHRPHYHVLFYVTSGVTPLTFSKMVSKCWQYGRTDGLPYQPVAYIAKHVYGVNLGFGANSSFAATSAACNYVSKYVTKNAKYRQQLDKRIDMLSRYIDDEDTKRLLRRKVDMFHRQSQGFGATYLANMLPSEIDALGRDEVLMKDKSDIVKSIPIPQYYKRKLYYVNKKRDDGTRYWEKTENGHIHDEHIMQRRIDSRAQCYEQLYCSLQPEYQSYVDKLLKGRKFTDLAIYELFYKDRTRDPDAFIDEFFFFNKSYNYTLTDNEYNLYDWLQFIKKTSFVNSANDDFIVVDHENNTVTTSNRFIYNYENYIKLH